VVGGGGSGVLALAAAPHDAAACGAWLADPRRDGHRGGRPVADAAVMTEQRGTANHMKFLTLVFVLSLPFWILGGVYPRELLPGVPLSALH
jgi:hypothetical protein